jgi:hypothetical protein
MMKGQHSAAQVTVFAITTENVVFTFVHSDLRSCVLCRTRPKHSHGRRQRQSNKIQDLNNGKVKTSNKIHFQYAFIKKKDKRKENSDVFEQKEAKFLTKVGL